MADTAPHSYAPSAEVQLEVAGMTCASCVHHVEKALEGVPGVSQAEVNLALERAHVFFDPQSAGTKDFVRAVNQAGYQVRMEQRVLGVAGLEEAPVRERSERALSQVPGVGSVQVNAAKGTVAVERVRGLAPDDDLLEALKKSGLTARLDNTETGGDPRYEEFRAARRRLAVSVLFTLPLWAAMARMFLGVGPVWFTNPWLEFGAASIVQWGPGYSFTRRAWLNVRHGNANMDVLVATGTLAAWIVSLYGLFAHAPLYFDTSATVITLILVGKYLEAVAKGKTSEAIRELLALTPKTARLVAPDGQISQIPVESIACGQHLEIRSGDRIPVDGQVSRGDGVLDESMLTGEPELKRKRSGDPVAAGTVHRGPRSFVMEATRVGRDTVLAQIVAAVEQAQAAKPPIQQFADRVANVFVPIVLAMAALTFAGNALLTGDLRVALLRAVAVLVVACPCSLGLATPTAVMVGSGMGARLGVLFRNGEALERTAQVNLVAMDKTGTLTEGRPAVERWETVDGVSATHLLAVAGALEQTSNHPLGRAIMQAAEASPLAPVDDVYTEEGLGMAGFLDGETVLVGSAKLLDNYGIAIPDLLQRALLPEEGRGRTVVWVAQQDAVLGGLVIADRLRPDARRAIDRLTTQGIRTVMLTGDRSATAERVAQQLGIPEVHAELSPQAKAEWIQEADQQGIRAAMVGDGINDAPALARAYIGMAVSSATDVAQETADVTLMRSEVGAVLQALAISQKTIGKIRQNLFWALFYNVLMIPLAALGVLSPMIAGAAMAFSSVTVVTNSLLLNSSKRRLERWSEPNLPLKA